MAWSQALYVAICNSFELAIEPPWSNGPLEAHIDRPKAINRQMYGRAGFELLRVLSAS
ncbi:MAG: transposase [Acidobacteriaceae bacterium]|nr:transposase [Acidobacteriaceae bacterium]